MRILAALLMVAPILALPASAQRTGMALLNDNHPIPDAHNCYPYEGQWADRLQRALKSGFPVAIEQDLAWYVDPASGKGRIAVTHSAETKGTEPGLRDYFLNLSGPWSRRRSKKETAGRGR